MKKQSTLKPVEVVTSETRGVIENKHVYFEDDVKVVEGVEFRNCHFIEDSDLNVRFVNCKFHQCVISARSFNFWLEGCFVGPMWAAAAAEMGRFIFDSESKATYLFGINFDTAGLKSTFEHPVTVESLRKREVQSGEGADCWSYFNDLVYEAGCRGFGFA